MYVMEENSMDPLPGISLLAALLDTTPDRLPDVITDEKNLEQARDMLYEALYCIIEHRDLPANKEANRAIGRILANAIRDHKKMGADENPATTAALIEELNVILTAIVKEAAGYEEYDRLSLRKI
jgi:hypothetical protein